MSNSNLSLIKFFILLFTASVICLMVIMHSKEPNYSPIGNSSKGCQEYTGFNLGNPSVPSENTRNVKAIKMDLPTWLWLNVCKGEILSIKASGQAAGGALPILNVFLNGRKVSQEKFGISRQTSIVIPESGFMTLSYLNDYYDSIYSMARISIRASGKSPCQNYTPFITEGSANIWQDDTRTLLLIHGDEVMIKACKRSNYEFTLTGFPALETPPTVQIVSGSDVHEFTLSESKLRFSDYSKTGTYRLKILNPFYKEIANRNLLIENIDIKR